VLIITAKIPRRRIALWSLAAAALCCCAFLVNVGGFLNLQSIETAAAVNPNGIKTNEDRIEYLMEYGWQAKPKALAVEELLIPNKFDSSYDDYLTLQSAQGFDLTKYTGKRVKRFTYEITNHPSGESGVQANLLIFKNTVIGGEVLSAQPDGFLHGLSMPAVT